MCLLLVLRPAAAEDAAADRLEFSAEPPVIAVPAGAPGRQFIELPTLEYRFDVRTACGADRSPRSLSINIADSRLALSGADLESRVAGELVLTVPARQLAPIAVDDFCVAVPAGNDGNGAPAAPPPGPSGAAAPAPRLLTVPAVVSAQASLVCDGADGTGISYVAKPLAVTLACTTAGNVAESPAGNAGNP